MNEFVGRLSDLDALDRHFDRRRLVTVLGPGGVGKTRFAREAAVRFGERHPDGVWFCDLSAVDDPAAVPFVVAAALDVNEHRGRSMTTALLDWIGTRRALIVLDNCEHVRTAVRDFVEELLGACPHVVALATSREPLRSDVEQRMPLAPLDPTTDAVDLFWLRASLINPELEPPAHGAGVAEICRLVEGIPLAIELAAARTAAMTPDEIATRLATQIELLVDTSGQRIQRHRTLAETINWSTALLTSPQRRILASLALFSGGFTAPAAQAVCIDPLGASIDFVDTLGVLVECSLVAMTAGGSGTTRYRMLEPIRQHMVNELSSGERHELGARHARWFAERSQQLQEALLSPDEAAAMDDTTNELPNLRQAHRWAVEHEPPTAGRLVSGLMHYTISRLHAEIVEWFDQTLAVLDRDDPWFHPTLAAAALPWFLQGRASDIRAALAVIDETQVPPFIRDNALMAGANLARYGTADLTPTRRLADRALEDGDWFMAVLSLGIVGRPDQALAVANRAGIPSALAYAKFHVARAAACDGRAIEAEQLLTQAIAHARSVQSRLLLTRTLALWAKIADRLGFDRADLDSARAESLAIWEQSGLDVRWWLDMVERDSIEPTL